MQKYFYDLISSGYGLRNASYFAAPRQFVAETYIVRTLDGQKLFCKIVSSLRKVLREHESEIHHYYKALQKLMVLCKQQQFEMVITHGDAGGNVLVKSPTDLYIVDWDEILLAPRERDLWVSDGNADFIKGYKSIFPGYRPNETARNCCTR
jgi:thiamine kinase-like enzyme